MSTQMWQKEFQKTVFSMPANMLFVNKSLVMFFEKKWWVARVFPYTGGFARGSPRYLTAKVLIVLAPARMEIWFRISNLFSWMFKGSITLGYFKEIEAFRRHSGNLCGHLIFEVVTYQVVSLIRSCFARSRCWNLVDPASSHMLVSKIKPCMSQYKSLYCTTANGSLKQL